MVHSKEKLGNESPTIKDSGYLFKEWEWDGNR